MTRMNHFIATLIALFAASSAVADVLRYEGSARDPDSGDLLYREIHYIEHTPSAAPQQRLVLYRCADNDAIFARKRVRYGSVAERPEFELEDARAGYREGVRAGTPPALIAFVQRRDDTAERTESLQPGAGFVADAGFDEFVKQHWDALHDDQDVRLDFLVPADLDTLPLKIRRHRQETIDGRVGSVIRLSLGSWWGFIAPHIDATYDQETRVLMRYQGISNLRAENGRNLEVRIDFPTGLRQPSDAASLQSAAQQALSASCIDS